MLRLLWEFLRVDGAIPACFGGRDARSFRLRFFRYPAHANIANWIAEHFFGFIRPKGTNKRRLAIADAFRIAHAISEFSCYGSTEWGFCLVAATAFHANSELMGVENGFSAGRRFQP